ncbi:Short-chain dehydrogenase [Granulicella pectinivorans]|uniref:Short-chain dehydrogenase n=1 Tax=Granulicella pectinivorans TaxID=474950 RepID=A0A1I6LTB3_9BACT|nr:oxidoreductase [Granulicella pectinivorans]SFS06512.1 Short-chain dehydrogenase [Granulicella pectinivorans]
MSNAQQGKVWFITGASTGFGRLLTQHLLILGAKVVATARKPEVLADLAAPNLLALELDVTKPEQIAFAVEQALARFGHVDVLVNNAGYGVTGAFEEVSDDELQPMFATNVFGLIHVTKALLPQFRARRSGNILNLSSIGGLIGLPGWSMYNATKFAVEGMSEALGLELAPLGIHVTIVEPGPFRTDFLGRSGVEAAVQIPDYAETAGKTREYFQTQGGKQAGDPQKAIEAMVAAASAAEPPRHLLLGRLALERYRAKIKSVEADIAAWEETTLGADFPK